MQAYARLLDDLIYTSGRNAKLELLARYLRVTPDPDRGWALASLTDGWQKRLVTPKIVRELIEARVDPVLYRMSHDFVGDMAETVALMWPAPHGSNRQPDLGEVVQLALDAKRKDIPALLEGWLDMCGPDERYALLKLLMGGMRVGVSARLAKTALGQIGDQSVDEIEEVWHGLAPPYQPVFDWLEGRSDRPDMAGVPVFRPLMLAHPMEQADRDKLTPADFAAEWKWDGIRVQISAVKGEVRLYSRTGDDISQAFPDVLEQVNFTGVVDGELLVMRDGEIAPFNDLQKRLGRKTVTKKMRETHPAHIRLYDLLIDGDEDIRALPFAARRQRLEQFHATHRPARMDVSALLPVTDWAQLGALRANPDSPVIEGLMLKRLQAPYVAGRPKGEWFKWKRDPLTADCVMMYAQRGHGKRSSLYSDYTFGAWRDGADGAPELVPVGKAYFGFTDEELKELDKFVRNHSIDRFGPVRVVEAKLVVELAFDAVHPSTRHKSGIAMRFPRVHRIRWDKPIEEADTVANIEALIR